MGKPFTRAFKHNLDIKERVQGPDEEMKLSEAMIEKARPRFLRPLETEGRQFKPCLVHGDLWWGNATMDADNDEPMIFDACVFWGHNECKSLFQFGTVFCAIVDMIVCRWTCPVEDSANKIRSAAHPGVSQTLPYFPTQGRLEQWLLALLCVRASISLRGFSEHQAPYLANEAPSNYSKQSKIALIHLSKDHH